VVLDGVVCASFEHLGDLCPLVVHDAVHQEQDPLLLFVPVDLLDARVEMVVPALTALLAHSTVEVLRDECPLLRPIGHNQLEDAPVLLRSPGSLHVEWLTLFAKALLWDYTRGLGGLRQSRAGSLRLMRRVVSCLLGGLLVLHRLSLCHWGC
jgi:hypothetical protein